MVLVLMSFGVRSRNSGKSIPNLVSRYFSLHGPFGWVLGFCFFFRSGSIRASISEVLELRARIRVAAFDWANSFGIGFVGGQGFVVVVLIVSRLRRLELLYF